MFTRLGEGATDTGKHFIARTNVRSNRTHRIKKWSFFMPLVKGGSKKAIGENIKIEESSGKKPKQAIAIALDVARQSGAKIPNKGKK